MRFAALKETGLNFQRARWLYGAHDMAREHRLMHFLRDSPVPVPRMVGLCQDENVNGRDFYLMSFLDGLVVRDIEIGRTFAPTIRTRVCHECVDSLCALHLVDIDAVGLGGLAGMMGYWYRDSEPDLKGDAATTPADGFLSKEELAGLYVGEMGLSLDKAAYYRAFASWRIACIGEGVYALYLHGQMGQAG
jgi:aminoglycoside phosphotransferase (APT) family kinase protein